MRIFHNNNKDVLAVQLEGYLLPKGFLCSVTPNNYSALIDLSHSMPSHSFGQHVIPVSQIMGYFSLATESERITVVLVDGGNHIGLTGGVATDICNYLHILFSCSNVSHSLIRNGDFSFLISDEFIHSVGLIHVGLEEMTLIRVAYFDSFTLDSSLFSVFSMRLVDQLAKSIDIPDPGEFRDSKTD